MAWAERVYKQDIPEPVSHDWDATQDLPAYIPEFYRAEPAVLEAVKIVRSRAGRVVR